eukprot:NODE_1_length_95616_cov_0.657642.p13 type:complete len:414 gc:universal NODE_1_length_95616_cov_0.657642:41109-42350(+)
MGLFEAKWKKEVIVEHKFSDIRISDFKSNSTILRIKYMFLYLLVLKSIAVLIADFFITYTYFMALLSNDPTSNGDESVQWAKSLQIYRYRPYLYIISVLFSSLLSLYEWRIARKIIKSGDIASAFTSEMASTYYSLGSFAHFCFFQVVSNSTKLRDNLAFFVFFSFKNWKFTAAETPRRVLNILAIIALYQSNGTQSQVKDIETGNVKFEVLSVYGSLFTIAFWFLGIIRFLAAVAIYVPLITTYIQGSVRGYATHKIDKRITQILNRKKKKVLAMEQKKLLLGKGSHTFRNNGNEIHATLPNVGPVREHIVGYDPSISPISSTASNYPRLLYQDYPSSSSIPYNNTSTIVSSYVSDFSNSQTAQGSRRPGNSNSPSKMSGPRSRASDKTLNSSNESNSTLENDFRPYRARRK